MIAAIGDDPIAADDFLLLRGGEDLPGDAGGPRMAMLGAEVVLVSMGAATGRLGPGSTRDAVAGKEKRPAVKREE